ncbi:MAG: alanine racemase [Betaproteobacteria bacterium]
MPRPILATIDRRHLRHNLAQVRQWTGDAKIWAVVKADAYGHGIERVFDALRSAEGFALLDLAEAQRLRDLGWRGPILLLEGCFEARDLELCSRLDLWHVVHCSEQIDMLAGHKSPRQQRVFLKLNSGMNRLGFAPERYRAAWARLQALPQVDDVCHATHFSDADGPRGIAEQLAVFDRVTADLPGERCLSNSAATLRHVQALQARSDWVRPGVALYGGAPDYLASDAGAWNLRPAMTLQSRLVATQELSTGDTVGYGSTFTAERLLRIGVVACGYADGYPRHAPTGTPVLIDGRRCPLVGRVSMDLITVDLSDAPQAGIGSEATLWGQASTGQCLPIDEVAAAAGTIGYELMCALAPRVPVRLQDDL